MKKTNKQNIQKFLRNVELMLTNTKQKNLGENELFSHEVQTLDGFRVGFMKPRVFSRVARRYGLNPANSEAILMQTTKCTDPHVHLKGESTFAPLGAQHGYPASRGGTYMGKYRGGKKTHDLKLVPAVPGKQFSVPAGSIHYFAPEKNAKFSAIAFVSPRIKQEDGSFDMLHFTRPRVSTSGARAVVSVA